ncbi:MAG: hypothetical protein IRY91_15365 [Gemmatimonadaceae bacterium]|nr:hypothetical protein [Gemmatimonadaceae bacterium]
MTDVARRFYGIGTIALVVLALGACGREEKGPNPGELKLRGTVHMVQSPDGGTCWKLQSTKGHDYELQPAQVPHDLLVDGATAIVIAKPRAGGSFCKVGQIVDVVQVDSIAAPATTASS